MNKTHIIAEIAWGHDGRINQAIALLKAAKEAKADSISIHITELEDYMVKHYGSGDGKVSAGRETLDVYKYLEKINLQQKDWILFKKEADRLNMKLCVMPNDISSLIFAEEQIKPDYYVVSAACFVEENFLRKIASFKRKTLFRIGGAYLGEIEKAVNIFREAGNNEIIILHGFQNYPTKLEETNICQLKVLKDLFGLEVGLADHIDGSDPISKVVPALALAYGATYIEKHLTLDREAKSEDFESALDPLQFNEFVHNVRAAEIAIGSQKFGALSDATVRYRNVSRKRIVAKEEISAGTPITTENISYKRSDIGLQPDQTKILLRRSAKENIKKDDSITLEKLL